MNNSHRAYATTSALVFALVALVQGVRAITGMPVRIGSVDLPVAASLLVALVCAALAVWGWRTR